MWQRQVCRVIAPVLAGAESPGYSSIYIVRDHSLSRVLCVPVSTRAYLVIRITSPSSISMSVYTRAGNPSPESPPFRN